MCVTPNDRGWSDLEDVFEHSAFDNGGYPGTYGGCTAGNKIDYILLLLKPWSTCDEFEDLKNAASGHAAMWVDLCI